MVWYCDNIFPDGNAPVTLLFYWVWIVCIYVYVCIYNKCRSTNSKNLTCSSDWLLYYSQLVIRSLSAWWYSNQWWKNYSGSLRKLWAHWCFVSREDETPLYTAYIDHSHSIQILVAGIIILSVSVPTCRYTLLSQSERLKCVWRCGNKTRVTSEW